MWQVSELGPVQWLFTMVTETSELPIALKLQRNRCVHVRQTTGCRVVNRLSILPHARTVLELFMLVAQSWSMSDRRSSTKSVVVRYSAAWLDRQQCGKLIMRHPAGRRSGSKAACRLLAHRVFYYFQYTPSIKVGIIADSLSNLVVHHM